MSRVTDLLAKETETLGVMGLMKGKSFACFRSGQPKKREMG